MKKASRFSILCLALISLRFFNPSVQAQVTIEYSAFGDNILESNGSLANVGDAVLLGIFPSNYDFSAHQTYASLTAPGGFTQLDMTSIGANSTTAGHFFADALVTTTAFNNAQFYIWILNNGTPANATSWVILTNPSWIVPPDAGGSTQADTSDLNTFIPPGAFGVGVPSSINNPAGNQTDWKMTSSIAAIPEPSTLGLCGFGALVLVGFRRRIKR